MKTLFVVVTAAMLAACSAQPATEATPAAASARMIPITSKSPEAIALFNKGADLLDNLRTEEAAAAFAEALKLDPGFVLAQALHGQAMPGPDGLKEVENAASAAKELPEAERVLLAGMAASRRGDSADATAAFTRVTELAPDDWRAHFVLGQRLLSDLKYPAAVQALEKATALNPNAGGAQNMLGYAAVGQGDMDGAIAAFTEYARILPQEPNPQDSLAEALMGAGRFKESEAAFQKALELSPSFWNAHQGIAYAKFYAGDWAGGNAALAKAKAGATRRADQLSVDEEMAAAAAAQRKPADALRILDSEAQTDGAQASELALVPVRRAMTLIVAGRSREALAPIAAALKTADSGQFTAGLSRRIRGEALRARIMAEVQLKDVAGAEKSAAALDQEATARPDDTAAQTAMHFGRGELAMAKADLSGARGHFEKCSALDEICKWQGVVAAEKAGDKTGAAAARESLLKVYRRDPVHLIVRSYLSPRTT